MLGAKPLDNVKFKLASEDSEIGIAPYGAIPMIEFSRPNTLDNKIVGHPVFLQGRHIAEGRTLAIPFAGFGHTVPLPQEDHDPNPAALIYLCQPAGFERR